MLNQIIHLSLGNRTLVLIVALALGVFGAYQLGQMPVDVFPNLNRPTVAIMTEATGLAPEEVEALVTRPIEFLLNGATGVKRVRSASGIGLSIVWIEFEWGTDVYRDRQVVAEKLQLAKEKLPAEINPVMAPISSIMGEIMLLGLRSKPTSRPTETGQMAVDLRTLAEFTVRNRLLAVEGVSQVTVMGGIRKQFQITTSPGRLAAQGVSLQQLTEAAGKANPVAGGGILDRRVQESIIRISGQVHSLEQIEDTVVLWRDPRPVKIRDVATVRIGGPVPRGDGGIWVKESGVPQGGDAVILAVQKQPSADTLALDVRLERALENLARELPSDIVIERRIFKQADFIRSAVDNVFEAVRDGALWVVIILFLFMWNLRVSVSSLMAMPLSILLTVLVFRALGISINTMTLGGIAVAIGDLVDDSIVDIENIHRRLKENLRAENRLHPLRVVYLASSEIRNSIVYATLIVTLVVLPLFALDGLEGRMFAPLGAAYIISLLASLLVSLTVTPVLGSILLPGVVLLAEERDPWLLRILKRLMAPVLRLTLRHANMVLILVAVFVSMSIAALFWMGGEFLPQFNEGTLTINVQTEPGTSLTESKRIARRVESLVLDVPEVTSVSRRTGRAELDEHAEGVNASEIDVGLVEHRRRKPGFGNGILRMFPGIGAWGIEFVGRERSLVLADIREHVSRVPGIRVNVGQPISHRLDHIMSGVRAQIAVKVFGPDLRELRTVAQDVQERMSSIQGVVDLQTEPQVEVPQLRLRVKHADSARYGLAPGDIAEMLETAYRGRTVSQILDDDRYFDLVVWFDEASRDDPVEINKTILDTPSGRKVALGDVVEVLETTGPNTIQHEGVQRRIAVYCNVQGRDLNSVAEEVERGLIPLRDRLRSLQGDYRIELGGQFEAQRAANYRLAVFGSLSILGIVILLMKALESWTAALQVLINIPLAAMGSIVALLLTNLPDWSTLQETTWWEWPRVWAASVTLSVAHWVGFITLIGIVSRNGIMMISHYIHLMRFEGEVFGETMIIRGSLERLAPVMMTALTSFIGLMPLLFGAGQTGKEILYPLSVVVFGGMLASTVLDQIVTPALFLRFGKNVLAAKPKSDAGQDSSPPAPAGEVNSPT